MSNAIEADYNPSDIKFPEAKSILIPDCDTKYTRALHCAGVKTFRHGYRYLLRTYLGSRRSSPRSISSYVNIPELLYMNTVLFAYAHEVQAILKHSQLPITINLRNIVQLEWYTKINFPDDYEIMVTERSSYHNHLRNHHETFRRGNMSLEHLNWISFWSNQTGYPKSLCHRLTLCNSSNGSENFVKLNLSGSVSWTPS